MADFVIKGLDFKKVENNNNTIRLVGEGRVFVPNYPGGVDYWYGCVGKYFPYEVRKSDSSRK